MRGWGIQRRVIFLALMPAALIALVLVAYFLASRLQALEARLDEEGNALVRQLAPASAYAALHGDREALLVLARATLTHAAVRSVTIVYAPGRPPLRLENREKASDGWRDRLARWWLGADPERLHFSAPIPALDAPVDAPRSFAAGRVMVELSTTATARRQLEEVANSLLLILCGLLASGLLAMRAGRDVTEPVLALTETVQRIGEGKLEARVAIDTGGELGELGRGINAMADALGRSRDEMQAEIDQATGDLRETLEAVEVRNAELDIARKRALEASRVKSDFLSSMSHEIRTPMNGIIGFSNLLNRTSLDELQRDYVQTISEAASGLLTVINDILDFSKVESGHLTLEALAFDLREVMDETLALLAPLAYEKGLELVELIYSDVPTRLVGDPVRIRQVVTNLVGNAVKFTERGSVVVRVMVEQEEGGQVQLRVTVSDTGPGVPRERRRGLFDAFSQGDASVTRHHGGTGLGLAISKRLVQLMLGEIGIDGEQGCGSTFWFTLRCEKQPVHEEPETAGVEGTVLLCEPHPVARLALLHRIGAWGARVSELESSAAVARALPGEGPLVVVSGLSSDDASIDEAAERIGEWRRLRPDVPVAILVNSVDQVVHERLLAAGADRVLPKLTRHDTLRHELEWLLDPERDPSAKPRLSVAAGEARGAAAEPLVGGGHFEGLRVLAVDDNPINLLLTVTLLQEQGVIVTQATDGEEAVARALDGDFDLILMDIQMPGVSGVEATRRIRAAEEEGARTPIIAVTAHALPGEQENFLQAGMDDCLIKPLGEETLWRTLGRWSVLGEEPRSNAESGGEENAAVYDEGRALALAGGREALARRLLAMLLEELPERREAIRAAHADGDLAELRERAHKLHGSAASCGTAAVQQAARRLETALDEGEGDIDALTADLDREVARLLEYGEESLAVS